MISAKTRVAECDVEAGDYHGALADVTEVAAMAEQASGNELESVYADTLARCEVLRVLLLLLIEPTAHNMSPGLTQVMEKYAEPAAAPLEESSEEVERAVRFLGEDMFALLQSLVMAAQTRDTGAALELEDYLAPRMANDPMQRALLRRLVKSMREKSLSAG